MKTLSRITLICLPIALLMACDQQTTTAPVTAGDDQPETALPAVVLASDEQKISRGNLRYSRRWQRPGISPS